MRLLLDSNVWRYVVDAGALGEILKAARKSAHSVMIAPATVYEALHTRDRKLRENLVAAMTLPIWKRLMPEVYSEAEELKSEIGRLRPEWLRNPPDLILYKRLRHDWLRARGGVWDRMRDNPEEELRAIDDAEMLEAARTQAHDLRNDARKLPQTFAGASLRKNLVSFEGPVDGWNGEPIELWRIDGFNVFLTSMNRRRHPLRDWIDGQVNLNLMTFQIPSLRRFWWEEVSIHSMPRHWLVSCTEFLQRFSRVTGGTPADCQLSAYLVDMDVFLSADKNFVRICERCRADAPFHVACSYLVGAGADAAKAVLKVLQTPATTSSAALRPALDTSGLSG